MRKHTIAWAITWRMVVHGVLLGIACGAIYGPISMVILYTAEVLHGRYTVSDFPFTNAITYCIVAVLVGTVFGGVLGLMGGIISGIILTAGILIRKVDLLGPNLDRNVIVGLCTIGSSIAVLLPLGQAVLGPGWFFNGPSVGVEIAFITLAILPVAMAAIATWWASIRIVTWWDSAVDFTRQTSSRERMERTSRLS